MMGRHQYINEDEYEVNLKDFEPQPGKSPPVETQAVGAQGAGGPGFEGQAQILDNYGALERRLTLHWILELHIENII